MNQKVAKLVSSTIMLIARSSSSTACTWKSYQPKVPQKLLDQKK